MGLPVARKMGVSCTGSSSWMTPSRMSSIWRKAEPMCTGTKWLDSMIFTSILGRLYSDTPGASTRKFHGESCGISLLSTRCSTLEPLLKITSRKHGRPGMLIPCLMQQRNKYFRAHTASPPLTTRTRSFIESKWSVRSERHLSQKPVVAYCIAWIKSFMAHSHDKMNCKCLKPDGYYMLLFSAAGIYGTKGSDFATWDPLRFRPVFWA